MPDESVRQAVLQLMEETLHSHQGMYTEPGTSLLETLAGIDAGKASRPHPPLQETIYGQVMAHIARTDGWMNDGKLAVVIGMTAHSAYHLGAIRQLKDL